MAIKDAKKPHFDHVAADDLELWRDKEEYLCNRPRRAADSLPVTLLEPIFGEFVDDCQNYQPTDHDNDFVWKLSENMSSFHPDELTRMNVFRHLLRGYGIILHSSAIGSTKYTTDGHFLSADGNFVQVILEGKNEIGSGGAEPFAESILEVSVCTSMHPYHWACIGFAGSVFIEKVQCDVLAPIIPLFWHSTDLRMQEMAARTFGALKIAIEKLKKLYSSPISYLKAEDSLRHPYPQTYTSSSGHIQEFSYDKTQVFRDRRIFFGKTVNDAAERKICIKFVRHYSPEAHRFCASKGHAPDLIAYEPLAGGWKMVIMDALDIDEGLLAQRPGSYRPLSAMAVSERLPLKEAITCLIEELHRYNGGYVHGDLRDTNFVVGDDNQFMLFDFDWAGPIEETRYPMHVNRTDIQRPEGACDGKKIVAKHDLEMLKYLFPEQDGREPVRKRPRLSIGEGSSI
ncbi:hypothetical protein BDR06DRAFT_1030345 [Suillus hirtellus]|nr:hypothetical protein BDR06DRAFT_1030345 [Suillus hirtellus]